MDEVKTPDLDNITKIKEIFEQLEAFCGDAHFVVSVSPTFDEQGDRLTPPFNISSLPRESVPDMLELMTSVIRKSDQYEDGTKIIDLSPKLAKELMH